MNKKIAVVLSGCGFLDGSEIHEAVLTLLALDSSGADYQCYAPDMLQKDVVNHLNQQSMPGESRNVLVEAARIARGNIRRLAELDAKHYDGIIFPGGFGAAKNLCSFAADGPTMTIHPEVERVARAFADAGKPAGYICIAPALIGRVYGDNALCTIGHDAGTAAAIETMGASHVECDVDDVIVDEVRRVLSTPAYMLAKRISEAAAGIERLVSRLLTMA